MYPSLQDLHEEAKFWQDTKLEVALDSFEAYSAMLAAQVEDIFRIYPSLESRLIQAGYIIQGDGVRLLHHNHYKIKDSVLGYGKIISRYAIPRDEKIKHFRCTCEDWSNGRAKHHWRHDRKTYPPHIKQWGICCRHVMAAIIWARIMGVEACPNCEGSCLYPPPGTKTEFWPKSIGKCTKCNGTGVNLTMPQIEEGWEYEDKIFHSEVPLYRTNRQEHQLTEIAEVM